MDQLHLKIKELRMKNGMTLKDLSAVTGLSVSFLSQIERGTSSLAITSLKKIADAFHVTMSYFFSDFENGEYTTRKIERKSFTVNGSDVSYIRMAGKFPQRVIEPMLVSLPPTEDYREKVQHYGEEFYYLLSGIVVFKIEGNEYELKEGDTIHFPSNQIHQWKNPTQDEVILISIVTPKIF
ncbi:helix-turn-helix domain-containing protein [Terribacillus halophilus]|jgi:transcriptional regulator with XRE-family HTH domain|uniref:helix-turn-helix domain-containing protein n=1 Tax=Terribacillus halophilus TaxID=361279 RepID=UPI000984AA7F|nr:XRE family transcriptional regulator [Terribacillus halophilus]